MIDISRKTVVRLFNESAGMSTVTGMAITTNWKDRTQQLFSISTDDTLRCWASKSGAFEWSERHSSNLTSVAVHPQNTYVATGGSDGRIILRDTKTGQLLHEIRAHTDKVSDLAFNPSGRKLFSTSFDRVLRVWDITSYPQCIDSFIESMVITPVTQLRIMLTVRRMPGGRLIVAATGLS